MIYDKTKQAWKVGFSAHRHSGHTQDQWVIRVSDGDPVSVVDGCYFNMKTCNKDYQFKIMKPQNLQGVE